MVRNICAMLPKDRFTPETIQRACGALETNCYELGWEGVRARALYRDIRYVVSVLTKTETKCAKRN